MIILLSKFASNVKCGLLNLSLKEKAIELPDSIFGACELLPIQWFE